MKLDPKNPDEALQIVDHICSLYVASRGEHYQIQLAIDTLKNVINREKQGKQDK